MNPSCRRFLSLSFIACIALAWVMAISGCLRTPRHVQSGSEKPLTQEQFREDIYAYDYLSVPETATDIRYSLSGYVRYWGADAHHFENWDIYASYKLTPSDLKNFKTNKAREGARFERRPISGDTLTWRCWRQAPRWWKPLDIKKGYFIRYSYDGYETRLWVNEDDNTVLVYEHED